MAPAIASLRKSSKSIGKSVKTAEARTRERLTEINNAWLEHALQQQEATVALLQMGGAQKNLLHDLSKRIRRIEAAMVEVIHTETPTLLHGRVPKAPAQVEEPEQALQRGHQDNVQVEEPEQEQQELQQSSKSAVLMQSPMSTGSPADPLHNGYEFDDGPAIQDASEHPMFDLAFPHVHVDLDDVPLGEEEDALRAANPTEEELDFMYGIEQEMPETMATVSCFGVQFIVLKVLEPLSMFCVVANTIFTGVQINAGMRKISIGEPAPPWHDVADVTFSIFFVFDLILRWYAMGSLFWFGKDKFWNGFDFFLVATSLVDLLVQFADVSFFRALRILRIMRALRGFRGLRAVRHLRLMLGSILASLPSLGWGICLLMFVMYIFSLVLMQTLIVYHDLWEFAIPALASEYFGSVYQTFLSLFESISGGTAWNELLAPLREVSDFYVVFFMCYIVVVTFGVLNILTALFCENASAIARVDKDLVIQEEMDRAHATTVDLKRFFMYADTNKDGKISRMELELFLASEERCAMLRLLAVDVTEARGLFELMDVRQQGQVDLDAFVDAIIRLKGAAKGCDTAMMLYETKRMLIRLASFMCYTTDAFDTIFQEMKLPNHRHVSLERYMHKRFLTSMEADAKVQIRSGFASHIGNNRSHAVGNVEQSESIQDKIKSALKKGATTSKLPGAEMATS